MLTVEEVAELLKIKPFTVRQMFREGRLRGFKVGKSWRITESFLEQDIRLMQGEPAPIETAAAAPVATDVVKTFLTDPPQVPQTSPRRDLDPNVTGHLIVFSDTPGQEVIVDGARKGVTTLSVPDLAVGTHAMKVGDVEGRVEIYEDFQTRVRATEESLQVLSQPPVITHDDSGAAIRDFRVRIYFKREADFAGSLEIDLSTGDSADEAKVERKIAEDHPAAQTITSSIAAEDQTLTTLFDGVINCKVGDALTIHVPSQPGFPTETEKTVILDTDLDITLTLTRTGRFRAKPTISFGIEPKI